ncbi:polysaccharide biosynthesis C-terminal domain-containing protein, partial [Candidatus Shapirobacteria bacterium]|nr:polysaccharide biosynthesis C-terminal domain-containing protein [Candidatus Shapirobacteria bacterium]
LQGEKEYLKKSLEKSIYFIALLVFPSLLGLSILAPDIINLIPKYGKWLPAVTPLYFYAASYAIASVTTPITNAFNATGHIKLTTKLMIMWTVLTWLFFPFLSLKFGYTGTAVASLIVGSSSFLVWYLANKLYRVNILKVIFHPLIGTLLIFLSTFPLNYFPMPLLTSVILKIIISVSVYGLYQFIFNRDQLLWFYNQFQKSRK